MPTIAFVFRKTSLFTLLTAAALFVLTSSAQAAAGDPDPSFGAAGSTTTPLAAATPNVAQVEVDSQGRTVVALGGDDDLAGDFSAARYLPDGDLDTSFGSGGIATVDIGGNSDGVRALAIDDQDRILLGGYAYTELSNTELVPLIRLNVDGTLDPSFGDAGRATGIPNRTSFNNYVGAIAIDPRGGIIASGVAHGHEAVMRFTSDGRLDPSFRRTNLSPLLGRRGGLYGLVAGPGKNVTATGSFGHGTLVVQLDQHGRLNRKFADHGAGEYLGKTRSGAYDLAVDSRGRMVVAGYREPRTGSNKFDDIFSVLRIDRSGDPDRSFGHRGSTSFDFCSGEDRNGDCFSYARSVDIDSTGRIVVAGKFRGVNTRIGVAAARLTPSGELDRTFADGGKLIPDPGLNDASADSTIDAEGRLITASAEFDFPQPTHHSLTVSRYLP